jgi:hypothetical protein
VKAKGLIQKIKITWIFISSLGHPSFSNFYLLCFIMCDSFLLLVVVCVFEMRSHSVFGTHRVVLAGLAILLPQGESQSLGLQV